MSPNTHGLTSNPLVKFGIRIGGLIILCTAGYFALQYASSGTLTVATGSNTAAITTSSIPPLQTQTTEQSIKPAVTKTSKGSMNVRLHAGNYIVTVQNGSSQESKLVSIGWLSHVAVTIKPASLGEATTEPVLYESVQNIAADSNRMIYLNNTFNGIEYINNQNQTQPITGNQYFTSVAWADPQYGIAQDNSGKLYIVNGSGAQPLQSPISNLISDAGASYAIAPNRTIYIALGSKVYRGTGDGNFSQIYSDFTASDSLVAANNQLMVINPNVGGSSNSGVATIITTSNKIFDKNFGYPVSGWTPWSANGKYIVISVNSNPEIFDASLKQVGNVPQLPSISIGAWSGDNTLYYASKGQLWSYDMTQHDTRLIANAPDGKNIQALTVSSDGAYVYATASNANGTYPRLVFRVGLKGQSVSSDLSALQDVLPISMPTYTIGLKNFSGKPVIDITTYPGTDPTGVQQSAQDIISGLINVNSVTFDVEAGD